VCARRAKARIGDKADSVRILRAADLPRRLGVLTDAIRRLDGKSGHVADCISCSEAPRADESGYCAQCYWTIRVEIEEGFADLRDYLWKWARFDEWEEAAR
jgi:hypothetical protein